VLRNAAPQLLQRLEGLGKNPATCGVGAHLLVVVEAEALSIHSQVVVHLEALRRLRRVQAIVAKKPDHHVQRQFLAAEWVVRPAVNAERGFLVDLAPDHLVPSTGVVAQGRRVVRVQAQTNSLIHQVFLVWRSMKLPMAVLFFDALRDRAL